VEFLYAVVGVVLGGLIAYYYSSQASKELRREANALRRETEEARHYINALISYLEAAGQISVRRDADGRPIQVQILRGGGIVSPRESSHAVPTLTSSLEQPQEAEDAEEPDDAEERDVPDDEAQC
jgi:hypothetical protein